MLDAERIDMGGGGTLLQSLLEIPVMYTTNFNMHYVVGGAASRIFTSYILLWRIHYCRSGILGRYKVWQFDMHLFRQIGKGIPKILPQSPPKNSIDG